MWERVFDEFLLFDCPINTSEVSRGGLLISVKIYAGQSTLDKQEISLRKHSRIFCLTKKKSNQIGSFLTAFLCLMKTLPSK